MFRARCRPRPAGAHSAPRAAQCGHCKSLAPEWKKAATQLKGTVRVGAVDCDENKELASKYGVKGFPTIKTFGEDKTAPPVDYTGAREAAAIVAHGNAALGAPGAGGSLVTRLAYLTAHTFLFKSGVPAVVLLTEGGAKTAPAWLTSLAVKFKEGKAKRVTFGHARVDDEPAIAARFGITDFPALVAVVPPGEASGEGHAVRYDKPIPASAATALRELRTFVDAVVAGDDAPERRLPPPAFPAPDVPRKQADVSYAPLTEDNLRTACLGGKKSMCVLALVAAPGGEFKQDAALQELARKYRNGALILRPFALPCTRRLTLFPRADPFSFVWLDASAQPEFAEALGVSPAETPALLVVKHGKRPRLARHQGQLTAAEVAPFLDRVLGGDVTFAPLKELPELMSDAMRDALRSADADSAAEL